MTKYVLILIMLNCMNCYDIRTDLITICSSNNKTRDLINLCANVISEPNYYYGVYSFCENMDNKTIIEPEFTSMCIDADKYMSNVNVISLREEYRLFFDKVNIMYVIVIYFILTVILGVGIIKKHKDTTNNPDDTMNRHPLILV